MKIIIKTLPHGLVNFLEYQAPVLATLGGLLLSHDSNFCVFVKTYEQPLSTFDLIQLIVCFHFSSTI